MSDNDIEHAATRLAAVRDAMARAAKLSGRRPDAVTLIAVSKTHDAPAIAPLIAAGQRVFGENRVQEAEAKWPALRESAPDVRLHLVGQLQSNKANEAVALVVALVRVSIPEGVGAIVIAGVATLTTLVACAPTSVAAALLVSCTVGLIFGVVPARRGAINDKPASEDE